MPFMFTKGLPSVGDLANRYFVARSRHRTELAIRALPIELQKDIGWPEPDDARLAEDLRRQRQEPAAALITTRSKTSRRLQ